MKSPNKPGIANSILHIAGILLCVVPPSICTAMYFPLWREAAAGTVIAGGGVLLLTVCALPLWKSIKRLLSSAASYTVWLILFLLFFSLSRIGDEMTVISFVGFISNVLGAICMRIAGGGEGK